MKEKMKKSILMQLATVLCLTLLFSVPVKAGSLNPGEYFSATISILGTATRAGEPERTKGFGGTIEDWGLAVSADSDILASLKRKNGSDPAKPFPTVAYYSWKLVDRTETITESRTGKSIYISPKYAGGYVDVTAVILSDDTWSASELTTRASVS